MKRVARLVEAPPYDRIASDEVNSKAASMKSKLPTDTMVLDHLIAELDLISQGASPFEAAIRDLLIMCAKLRPLRTVEAATGSSDRGSLMPATQSRRHGQEGHQ